MSFFKFIGRAAITATIGAVIGTLILPGIGTAAGIKIGLGCGCGCGS